MTHDSIESFEIARVCRLCDRAEWDVVFAAPCARTLPEPDVFRYGECRHCGSLTLLDSVDPISFYLDGYERHGVSKATPARSRGRRAIGFAGDQILRRLPLPHGWWIPAHPTWLAWFRRTTVSRSSPILDIGCGSGALLVHLSRFGFANLHGIDPYLDGVSAEIGPVRLARRGLEAECGRYNAIIFNHSLEHVDDPLEQLIMAKQRLERNGVIIVDLPIVGGRAWHRFRENWAGLDAPLHRFVPSPAGLAALAGRAGLKVVRWRGTTAQYFYTNSMLIQVGASPRRESATTELGSQAIDWCRKQAARDLGSDASQASFVLTSR